MMLRRTKPSNKKRHSMFIDVKSRMSTSRDGEEEISRYMYQTKNRSLDNLKQMLPEVHPTPRTHPKTRLKRSSVVLDNTLVRDYNLAVDHFEKREPARKPVTLPSPDSCNSLSSQVSSLFSSTSTMSIRDYLFEEDADVNEPATPVKNCQRLLNVGDRMDREDSNNDDIYDLDLQNGYFRTSLEFD